MLVVTATFDSTIRYFVAANVIAILDYILIIRHRKRALHRNVTVVANAITDYFRDSGAEVAVECIGRPGGRQFVALISSKSTKRFRHSNIVEIFLTTHVRKTCSLELEKVYWCFSIKTKQETSQRDTATASSDMPATVGGDDEYVEEDLANLGQLPGYGVKVLSLKKYQEFVNKQPAGSSVALDIAAGA